MGWIKKTAVWAGMEYIKNYRESKARVFDTIIQNNLRLNTVILTVSVASLTAIAALSEKAFENYPFLSFTTITLFVLVVLLSTVNFYLSGIVLTDFQKKLNKDLLFPVKITKGEYEPKFSKVQNILSKLVLSAFCLGLILLLVLLGAYTLGYGL